MVHHREIFAKAIELKCNKAICNESIIIVGGGICVCTNTSHYNFSWSTNIEL